jgi:plastocyanin
MRETPWIRTALPCAAALLLMSCSGGGGSGGGPPGTGTPTNGTVTGRISADGVSVTGVVVTLGSSTITNGANGSFTFSDVPAGTQTVTITVPGNFAMATGQTAARQVTVTGGQTTTANFALALQNPAAVVEISLLGTSFSPADVSIAPGTTVRWVNGDGQAHTVTPNNSSQAGVWARQASATSGAIFLHTFPGAGEYGYHCEPHQAQGTRRTRAPGGAAARRTAAPHRADDRRGAGDRLGVEDLRRPLLGELLQPGVELLAAQRVRDADAGEVLRREAGDPAELQVAVGGEGVADAQRCRGRGCRSRPRPRLLDDASARARGTAWARRAGSACRCARASPASPPRSGRSRRARRRSGPGASGPCSPGS